MDAFTALRQEIKTTLEAAGLDNVSLDPRLEPPGILVDAPSFVDPRNGGATWLVSLPVRIIAPPPGDVAALDYLLTTLEPVLIAVGADEANARSSTYDLNDKPHPAYSVEINRTLVVPC